MSPLLLQLRSRSAHGTLAGGYSGRLGSRAPPQETFQLSPRQHPRSCELVSSASTSTGDASANRDASANFCVSGLRFPCQGKLLSWAVCALLSAGLSSYSPLPGLRSTRQSGFAISSHRQQNCSQHNLNRHLQGSWREKSSRGEERLRERDNPTAHSESVSSFLEELPRAQGSLLGSQKVSGSRLSICAVCEKH